MTTQDELAKEKQKIWDELDKADAGQPAAATEPSTASASATPAEPAAHTPPAAEQAASTSATGEADDPYANVPSIIRDEISGLKAMLSQQATQIRNTAGHIGGLNSTIKELKEAAKTTSAAGRAAPTQAELQAASGNAQAMAKLKEDYPEFGSAMEAALEEKLGAVRAEFAKATPVAAPAQNALTQEDLEGFRREFAVERAHAGWQETVKTPAFRGWLQGQPREVQMLAASESPQDAVRLLDLHKEAREAGAGKTTQRLDAAAAIPTGRAAASARAKPVEQMTKAEYWKYLDEQDAQKAKAA